MKNLSAVLIVKNESQNIAKCLSHLSWVDEIVVLDTGSTDDTIQLCKAQGAKVFIQEKWEGFGKAKQEAVKLATNDWILSIDADEILSVALIKELISLRERDFEGKAWRLWRRSFYLNKPIRFCGWDKDILIRIFNRQDGGFDDKELHESIHTSRPKQNCKAHLYHYPFPTTHSHFQKMRSYGEISAKRMHKDGKRTSLIGAIARAKLRFFKMYLLQLGFLDGISGLRLCLNSAWGVWYKYYRLWQISK